ncbi:MAG: hypothetical protein OSJ43_06680 [Oscillospiraceae bacterium]|nr:hypothetical protein [Oscillospiraceae bacterium]
MNIKNFGDDLMEELFNNGGQCYLEDLTEEEAVECCNLFQR